MYNRESDAAAGVDLFRELMSFFEQNSLNFLGTQGNYLFFQDTGRKFKIPGVFQDFQE